MATKSSNLKRLEITYFEGVNSLVGSNISKKEEFEHVENARSTVIGTIEKRLGYQRLGNEITSTANFDLFYFNQDTATITGFYRISTVSATTSVYYLHTDGTWTALAGGGTSLSIVAGEYFSTTNAEGCLFYVNGTDNNMQINSNGTTVVESTATTGHLYSSPKARKINYYKDRLYLGDYTNTTRYKNGIMRSSVPLGIVSLINGDHDAAVTTLNVTDTKYIRATDSLDVYRGNVKIETITVSAKGEDFITVSSTGQAINSADELWVAGTYTGAKLFRWADNPSSGIDAKEYDTFKLSGGENDRIKMLTNIGNVQMVANSNNIAIWDDYRLENLDLGIGCVSDNGWVKALGTLWFIHYGGIYSTTGSIPKLMSAKVEKYITGSTKTGLDACAAGKKGYSVFFHVGTVTLYKPDGSADKTLTNTVLEYNLRQENWYVHTGIDADIFQTYIGSTDADRLQFCGSSGHVYEFLRKKGDDTSTDIPMMITTTPITLAKEFEKISYPKEIIIEMDQGNTMKAFVSLDGAPFYEIQGEANKGCTILKVTNKDEDKEKPPRCRNIRISFREFSGVLCRVLRIAIIYAESEEEEEFKPSYE